MRLVFAILCTVFFAWLTRASNHESLAPVPSQTIDSVSPNASAAATRASDTYNPNIPIFEPEREWKEVLPGQAVPQGLEISINLQTGRKMARLLPEDGASNNSVRSAAMVRSSSSLSPSLLPPIHHPSARDMLSPVFKVDIPTLDELETARAEMIRHRAAADNDMDDLHLVRLMLQVLVSPTNTTLKDVVGAFEILEDVLHDGDTALDFAKMGGIDVILDQLSGGSHAASSLSNSSRDSLSVQALAAWVLGTVTQNSPRLQAAASDHGAVLSVVNILRSLVDQFRNSVVDSPPTGADSSREFVFLGGKLLFALDAVIRSNGQAQEMFALGGGFDALADMVDVACSTSFLSAAHRKKLQRKLAGLLFDLLADVQYNFEGRHASAGERDAVIPSFSQLGSPGWCPRHLHLLAAAAANSDLLLAESVVKTMNLLYARNLCAPEFRDPRATLGLTNISRIVGEAPGPDAHSTDFDDAFADLRTELATLRRRLAS